MKKNQLVFPVNQLKKPIARTITAASSREEKHIEEVLADPILLSDRVRSAVDEADSFKLECSQIGNQADRLCQMLRSAVRLATSPGGSLYERPVRRIVSDVVNNLDRALTQVRKCKRRSFLRRLVTIVSAADFRKVLSLLESSVADMKWLLSIFDHDGSGGCGGGIVLSLPPIASNDPIISWVWSFIATLYVGQLDGKIEAANELALLANDNDRTKKIIAEQGGIAPLLRLLTENSSTEAQIAAAVALYNLSNNEDRVRAILDEVGVLVIVHVLRDAPMEVQIHVANLVAVMAEHCPRAQEDFARQNVIRPLVTLLSFDIFMDDSKLKVGKQSLHSIVQITKELEKKSVIDRPGYVLSLSMHYPEGSSRGGNYRNRESEKPEVKLQLKISCAKALWMLARGSISNSQRITDTKGLICLAKLVEKEQGELQVNCLMGIMEITAAADSSDDLRRAAFKTNSPAAKAVVDQLLRVIIESDDPTLQIPAIRSIGSLARTFSARETRVIGPLVEQLSHWNQDVAAEAAFALRKFACLENYLCVTHSKAIIDSEGVPALMKMLRGNEHEELHGLVLLCYLALHAGNNEALEQARVLNALEGADHALISQHPELKELISKAVYYLNVYHSVVLSRRESYAL